MNKGENNARDDFRYTKECITTYHSQAIFIFVYSVFHLLEVLFVFVLCICFSNWPSELGHL